MTLAASCCRLATPSSSQSWLSVSARHQLPSRTACMIRQQRRKAWQDSVYICLVAEDVRPGKRAVSSLRVRPKQVGDVCACHGSMPLL